MKILVAGSFKYPLYDEACANALEKLGCEVLRFRWQRYYGNGIFAKMQQRWLTGPGIVKLNSDILHFAQKHQPNLIFITRGVPIWPETLRKVKKYTNTSLISYNNDDPFGGDVGKDLWKYFIKSIPLYDWHYVFRELNISDYIASGAKGVDLLLPYHVPDYHFPIQLTEVDKQGYPNDVVFVGHAKRDSRLSLLKQLIEEKQSIRIYGWNWDKLETKNPWLKGTHRPPVWGLEYTRTIRAAKIALVFFSENNRDTYTTRSFEIPAIGTCMLSQRTNDMLRFFREDIESAYFSSPEELNVKVKTLLSDNNLRDMLAENGRKRVVELKATVDDRMASVLAKTKQIIQAQ